MIFLGNMILLRNMILLVILHTYNNKFQ